MPKTDRNEPDKNRTRQIASGDQGTHRTAVARATVGGALAVGVRPLTPGNLRSDGRKKLRGVAEIRMVQRKKKNSIDRSPVYGARPIVIVFSAHFSERRKVFQRGALDDLSGGGRREKIKRMRYKNGRAQCARYLQSTRGGPGAGERPGTRVFRRVCVFGSRTSPPAVSSRPELRPVSVTCGRRPARAERAFPRHVPANAEGFCSRKTGKRRFCGITWTVRNGNKSRTPVGGAGETRSDVRAARNGFRTV